MTIRTIAFVTTLALASGPVAASNLLTFSDTVAMGADNALQITGSAIGDNVVNIRITGDRNGGTGAFSGQFGSLLQPGTLLQDGTGNALTMTVEGNDNLFAVEQIGTGNIASIIIEGSANQTLLSQTGAGNIASITQVGSGNLIAVRQRGQ